jgi:hypothetical protein
MNTDQRVELLAARLAKQFNEVTSSLPVSVKQFGAIGDNKTDDTAAVIAAMAYCSQNAATLIVPAGTYRITQPLEIALQKATGSLISGGRRMSIIGSSLSNSTFIYSGTSTKPALSIRGTYDDQLNIDGLNVLRADAAQIGTGIYVDRQVNFSYKNIRVSFFDTGFYGLNINEGSLHHVICDWNNVGLYFTTSSEVLPNANTFTSCHFNSNNLYGCRIQAGCSNTFINCVALGNGSVNSGAGFFIEYGQYNGSEIATFVGGYFENNGKYTVHVIASAGGAITFTGGSFNKQSSGQYATHHLFIEPLNLVADDGKIIKVILNGFSTFVAGDYVPSSTRPDVVLSPGLNGYNGYEIVNNGYYQSTVERPDLLPGQIAIPVVNNELDLKRTSVPLVYINSASGTIKRLRNGVTGQFIILQSDNSITLEHNANIILKNQQNYTLTFGQTITLYKQSPGQYREICRQ